jgi:murein DD-endopeptidase MepM/ murein hydrolase activator NlpD
MTFAWRCPRAIALLTCVLCTLAAAIALRPGQARSSTASTAHDFPVQAHWTDRGATGDFGAPRDGGRIHEGFDIVAKCGAKLVAVTDGKVIRRGFDPVLYGNYVLLSGNGEGRTYFYAHLVRPPAVKVGEQVGAGQFVGNEGKTGNAATIGCHLHFEIRDHGRPINPEPLVRKWDRQR